MLELCTAAGPVLVLPIGRWSELFVRLQSKPEGRLKLYMSSGRTTAVLLWDWATSADASTPMQTWKIGVAPKEGQGRILWHTAISVRETAVHDNRVEAAFRLSYRAG